MNNKYRRSFAFWKTSLYYLNLVEAVINETIKQGNIHSVISNFDISEKKYRHETKWSDHNIVIPILYDFYHGLELLLKGFILFAKNSDDVKLNHNIELLLENFTTLYSNQKCLIDLLKKYISKTPSIEPLKNFFKENNITTDKFYEALRYPVNKKLTKEYDHIKLMYHGEDGLEFFKELKTDLDCLMRCSVSLGKELENQKKIVSE